jgi:hypothetical protein
MTSLQEGDLKFDFPDGWRPGKYDAWQFYQKRFKDRCGGAKAVDFVALDPESETLWLIEVKDYRSHARDKSIAIRDEFALKVKDTLAGLLAAKMDHNHDEQEFAAKCLRAKRVRVVLHLEQPAQHSRLFPRVYNLSNVQRELKTTLKPIDAHPLVVEIGSPRDLAWQVASEKAV